MHFSRHGGPFSYRGWTITPPCERDVILSNNLQAMLWSARLSEALEPIWASDGRVLICQIDACCGPM